MNGGVTILHLSDLHYGVAADGSRHQLVKRTGEPDPEAVIKVLRRDELLKEPPTLIIVSGDLGWSGTAEDYRFALAFLEQLRGMWQPGTPVPILVSPGNHDVNLGRDVPDEERQAQFTRALKSFYGDDLSKYYPLLDQRVQDISPRELLIGFTHVPGTCLAVSVNSAAYINAESYSGPDGTDATRPIGPIEIKPSVLEFVEEECSRMHINYSYLLKIFVIHHNIFHISEPPFGTATVTRDTLDRADRTIVANSARLQAWLARAGFGIVLHGHKHLAFGREDILFRHEDPGRGRKLAIVGTGSAGVYQHERSEMVPLSYNVLRIHEDVPPSWRIRVYVRAATRAYEIIEAKGLFQYDLVTGNADSDQASTTVFQARRMDLCHAQIRERVPQNQDVRNFVSIVEGDLGYHHPPTLWNRDHHPDQGEVWRSFLSLHPEFNPHVTDSGGWDGKDDKLKRLFESARDKLHFRIDHGARLFGQAQIGREKSTCTYPIDAAVGRIDSDKKTRAYVGLYDPLKDANADDLDQPLPGLVGLQFIKDSTKLDVVATFRGLELSFWWAVNMLEVGLLLHYAAKNTEGQLTPRRIVFFAAVAHWKRDNPEAIFGPQVDVLPEEEITLTLLKSIRGDPLSQQQVMKWISDKISCTNVNNIDTSGIVALLRSLRLIQKCLPLLGGTENRLREEASPACRGRCKGRRAWH